MLNLLKILEEDAELLERGYQNSPYFQEVSYEEYFMWAYHILYSEVTEMLIDSGMIYKPRDTKTI